MVDRPANQAPVDNADLAYLYTEGVAGDFQKTLLAKFASSVAPVTTGQTFYIDASGNCVKLAAGSNGDYMTIAAGLPSWSALGTIAIANGGTGATTAANARTNLGLVIGTNVQAQSTKLSALDSLSWSSDLFPYFTGASTVATASVTSFARTILDDTTAAAVRSTIGAISPDVQIFTASGTWNKPSGSYSYVIVECWGAGGGGGSGRRGAAASARGGGAGGGGGSYVYRLFAAADVAITETITIGAGGTAGAARSTDNTDGAAGADGGNTTFGAKVSAFGGGGGGGGTATTANGGAGAGVLSAATTSTAGAPDSGTANGSDFGGAAAGAGGVNGKPSGFGGAGGAGSTAAGTPGFLGGCSYQGGPGGGSGGSITSGNTAGAGGGGGTITGTSGGGSSGGTANGGAGGSPAAGNRGGGAGGGGGNPAGGAGGTGGAGGVKGSGGGGGGASFNGSNSGAGGAGGYGYCIVTTI